MSGVADLKRRVAATPATERSSATMPKSANRAGEWRDDVPAAAPSAAAPPAAAASAVRIGCNIIAIGDTESPASRAGCFATTSIRP